jgi:hypothetical protein
MDMVRDDDDDDDDGDDRGRSILIIDEKNCSCSVLSRKIIRHNHHHNHHHTHTQRCGPSHRLTVLCTVISAQADKAMGVLGKELPTTGPERQHTLMKLVSEYCKIIRQGARGDYRDPVKRLILTIRSD